MNERGTTKRRWFKIYSQPWLNGSIRYQLEPDERSVWADLLAWANVCSPPGTIADNDNRAFPHDFIANRLNIPLELLESTIEKSVEEGRIVVKEGVITITNWTPYQSEYDRVKKYRGKEPTPPNPDKYVQGEKGHMVRR